MSEPEHGPAADWRTASSSGAGGSPAGTARPLGEHELPPGWSYNPSAWPERAPLVGLALVGCAIAAYLASFQVGVVTDVWEPFFGNGSRLVLTSPLSRLLPVTDATLGAFGYLLDAAGGSIGGNRRWRTMPWIVILFGLAVGPLGAVSIFLVIAQPVLVGTWCTLCLVSATLSLTLVGPAMDEVLASLQHLKRASSRGDSLWRVFWGLAPSSRLDHPGREHD